ncbi:MAG: GGDEF domain-containing protein [Acidobacteriota bacterium]|nr:GGDEF domain-containing protein [Acidobacteriota bacterium]
MQTYTLLVVNLLMFVMYAGVLLVSARINGGSRGATWFAGANLCHAAAIAVLLREGDRPLGPALTLFCVLVVGSTLMLHRSFAELLDRARMLWSLQLVLLAVVTLSTAYAAYATQSYPWALLITSAVLGVQLALVASVVFSFAGEGVEAAGAFTGITLTIYAFVQMLRVAVMLRSGQQYVPSGAALQMEKLWLLCSLLVNGAVAFGFMFISAAKLRLELLWRAQIDELTGLLNRWAFKRVALKETFRARRMGGRLAVMMMDVDGLKGMNDRYGHGCGDAVLQSVAAVLQDTVRDHDSVARMGGDEFCILLPDTEMDEALKVAERLRAAIAAMAVKYRGVLLEVHASFGLSSSDRSGLNWQTLVDQGDAALYEAKRAGRNRVVAAKAIGSAVSSSDRHGPADRRRR